MTRVDTITAVTTLHRRIGFEIELLAPDGLDRRRLADDLAGRHGGTVRGIWHQDFGPSELKTMGGRFLQLSQGFEVRRAGGEPLCTLVDDISLLHDLTPETPPVKGWYRLVTDDFRLSCLLADRCDPEAAIDQVLEPPAAMWRASVRRHDDVTGRGNDVYEFADRTGNTIALASPYGGGRERACEIVTPPLAADHTERLEELLAPARELGFSVPFDGSVHLHVDGAPFRRPHALANVIRLFAHWRDPLRTLLATNPASNRLAPLPEPLVAAAEGEPSYERIQQAAEQITLSKFFDVNVRQLLKPHPERDTLEIRILPSTTSAEEIAARAATVESLLARCEQPTPIPLPPPNPAEALDRLRSL